jgi:hypothetical protein
MGQTSAPILLKRKPRQSGAANSMWVNGGTAFLLVARGNTAFNLVAQVNSECHTVRQPPRAFTAMGHSARTISNRKERGLARCRESFGNSAGRQPSSRELILLPVGHFLIPSIASLSLGCRGCGGRTRSGNPCRSPAVTGRRRCLMHGGAPGIWRPQGPTKRQQAWPVHRLGDRPSQVAQAVNTRRESADKRLRQPWELTR